MASHPPFSRAFLILLLALAASVALASCGTLKKLKLPGFGKRPPAAEKVEATPAPAPKPVFMGTITMVNAEDRFVLIDAGSSMLPAKGMALKSMSGGVETGIVTIGDVTRRPFAIADIVSGNPAKGDQVFQ